MIEGDTQTGPTVGLANRGNSHLIVYDYANNIGYEFYQASRPSENSDGEWNAVQETVWNFNTNQFCNLGETSADAAGLSILAGLVRPDEGLPVSDGGQGAIDHAIRITLPSADILDQFIYPAAHEANSGTNTAVQLPMGARLRLNPSFNISYLDPESQIIAKAMQTYGVIVADNGSTFYLSGASYSPDSSNDFDLTWNDNDIQSTTNGLKSIPISEFQVLNLTPVVTGLSETTGSAGTTITVTGQNFSGAAGNLQVLFGKTAATNVTYVSDSQITCTVPAGSGTVNVQVQSGITTTPMSENYTSPIFGYGISATSSSDLFTYGTSTPTPSASSLELSTSESSTTAGTALTVTVTALTSSGTTDTDYTGTVYFTSSDSKAVLPANYTFTTANDGVDTFTVTLKTAGTDTITVTDSATSTITGSASVTVTPAAASSYSLSGLPSSTTAGTALTFTVTVLDPYGNVATGYTGMVHFTSSDAQAALPANYTFTAANAGAHSFSATLNTAGTDTITATDTATSSLTASASVTVHPIPTSNPPTITRETPAANARGVKTNTTVTAVFSEAVQSGTISFVLKNASGTSVPATLSYNSSTLTATLTPSTALAFGTTYTATVSGAENTSGTAMTAPVRWSFTTLHEWNQATPADLNAGTNSGTALVNPSTGGLQLASTFCDTCTETTLSSAWTLTTWASGGKASFANGTMSITRAMIATTASAGSKGVQASLDFGAATYQHFGLATGLASVSGNSWALFSTMGTTNTLYARVNVNGKDTDVSLGALLSGWHTYQISPVRGGYQFYVDGSLKTTITGTVVSGTPLKVVLSSYTAKALQAEMIRLVSYVSSGTYTSAVYNTGTVTSWGTASWTANLPAGTTMTVEVRSGNTASQGSGWSSWTPVTNGGPITCPVRSYLQYKMIFTTTHSAVTPSLTSIDFTWM